MLARGFSEGLERFDFGGTEEAFKLEWANGRRELVHFQCFARSPLGQLDRAAAPLRRYGPVALSRLRRAIRR
jgi:CelD/BcsL family acetyltransferase involved in cellulose biosynthesis